MTTFLDKLNLRPGERRLVVFGLLAVFVVINIWLVIPQFGKVSFWDNRRLAAEQKINRFQAEIAKRPSYEKLLKSLETLGAPIPVDEQQLDLQRNVISYAALTGVTIDSSSPVQKQGHGGRTNAFFEEQTMNISVNSGEPELVDFLYQLGRRNSMIRVRTMNLGPDPTRMRLKGQIALVASYQKKPPPRSVASLVGVKSGAMTPKTNVTPKVTTPGRTNQPAARTNTGTTAKPPTTTSVKPGTGPKTFAATTNAPAPPKK